MPPHNLSPTDRRALERRCLERLADLGVTPTTHHHPPVYTVDEARRLRGALPGAHVKNLLVRDRKKTRFFLITAPELARLDLKALARHLAIPGALRFASPDHLTRLLGVEPGAVTPLAAMNDLERRVSVVLDAALLNAPLINVHPLHNAATTALLPADLVRFLEACDHPPRVLDLPCSA